MNERSRTVEQLLLVVLLLDEVVEALLERVEEDRVLVDVLQEVLARRLTVSNWISPSGP